MYLRMAKRVLLEADKRLVLKFVYLMGFKGIRSVQKHKRRLKRGEVFPPFLYVSIINSCNLRCQGCWVDVAAKQQTIDVAAMDRLIGEAQDAGNVFFGILGGEPFMHPELLEILGRHPGCYFQVFTNGHFITDETAKEMRRLGNVTPLVSIEGTELVSNERRGRLNVLSKTMEGLSNCLKNRLLTGVATSLCQTNFDDLLTEKWLDRLIEMGVFYAWYHTYRPVGPDAKPELALTPEQQRKVRKFVVEMRCKKPIALIDAYYDHQGQALCPAATGISHHINPWGDIEPCPIVQFTKESIHDERGVVAAFRKSEFLSDFRDLAASATRGCIVLERPDLLRRLVEKHSARDATARHKAMKELEAMQPRPSQYDNGNEIPEKSWAYRFVKRFWFNDFGKYAKVRPIEEILGPAPAPASEPVGAGQAV
ncbi:MAG: radical SAM protein [Planctomycetia bacterium]|nr:radical SAM protein [Planctomycetia bacterium]